MCFASHANGILVQFRSRVCVASSICWKILIGYRSNKSYGWWHRCVWHIFQLNMRIRLNDSLTEMDAEIYISYSRTWLFYSNMLRNANDANIDFFHPPKPKCRREVKNKSQTQTNHMHSYTIFFCSRSLCRILNFTNRNVIDPECSHANRNK